MKKTILTIVAILGACLTSLAVDMTTVWDQIQAQPEFIVSEIGPEQASFNGFEKLTVALNSAPTDDYINQVKRLAATIDPGQKVTSVSQKGVDVAIYAAPASATGDLYKMMIFVDKNDNEDKSLIVLYGITNRDDITRALSNLSIESLIGG